MINLDKEIIRLTQFSPGAGCGCKIAPRDLEDILKDTGSKLTFPNLIVGNTNKDDAAVYNIGNGMAIISTTDFFTPIVDDPENFGRISATNAISDIYAMGGRPLMAIAILGWPLEKLSKSLAAEVIAGATAVCDNAGIPLSGGHSINISDPIFGLAVTGIVEIDKLKQNSGAKEGDLLYLTKPIGIGLVTTAEKQGFATEEHRLNALKLMTTLNTPGLHLSSISEVNALTDVTGFGLAGHAIEMAQGSNLTAIIKYDSIPKLDGTSTYIDNNCIPGGTYRNFNSYSNKIKSLEERKKMIMCDPQTSGGLLIAVSPQGVSKLEKCASENNFTLYHIGKMAKYNPGYFLEVI